MFLQIKLRSTEVNVYKYLSRRGVLTDAESPKDEEHPAVVAETVFRDLVCRASYGNISSVIKPVLAWVFIFIILLFFSDPVFVLNI